MRVGINNDEASSLFEVHTSTNSINGVLNDSHQQKMINKIRKQNYTSSINRECGPS